MPALHASSGVWPCSPGHDVFVPRNTSFAKCAVHLLCAFEFSLLLKALRPSRACVLPWPFALL